MRARILLLAHVLHGQRPWRHRDHTHDDVRLGVASSCRYSNVPWSDCDPLSWLRTKTVELVKDKKFRLPFLFCETIVSSRSSLSSDNCPETREFSQTCSMNDLPPGFISIEIFVKYVLQRINCSGVKQLLTEHKLLKSKEEIYSVKINKINAFFEDVKVGVMKVLHNLHQLGMM